MNAAVRSLRLRLGLWFTLGILVVTVVFCLVTYHHLYGELHEKQLEKYYPDHAAEWVLHGKASEEEIRDIMTELMEAATFYALPFLVATIAFGYFVAGKSLEPIAELNRQMSDITSASGHTLVRCSAKDSEFRSLTRHLNELLERLGRSFDDMREYSGKVAHELKTPLTILRLKVERTDERMAPSLREEFLDELQRMARLVDQSLLVAKCEKGTLQWRHSTVDVSELVQDIVDDFRLLAEAEGRHFEAEVSTHEFVRTDPAYLKQIIQGLFANALKHGNDRIAVRLAPKNHGKTIHFTLMNSVGAIEGDGRDAATGLGLGLRVAKALIALQSDVRFQRHHGRRCHAARLIMPAASAIVAGSG